jgi:hypothetical protein
MLLRFGAYVLGHGIFGQIQKQFPILYSMIGFIAPLIDDSTPKVNQRLLLIRFRECFSLIQFQ